MLKISLTGEGHHKAKGCCRVRPKDFVLLQGRGLKIMCCCRVRPKDYVLLKGRGLKIIWVAGR